MIPVSLDPTDGTLVAGGVTEGWQWWQTFTLHAVGVGQQDMGIWVPYDCTLLAVRYRTATAGTGGSLTAELRRNGVAGGNTVSGTSAAPSTTPSWTVLGSPVDLDEDDLLWCWVTAINTTPGAQLKVEARVMRR